MVATRRLVLAGAGVATALLLLLLSTGQPLGADARSTAGPSSDTRELSGKLLNPESAQSLLIGSGFSAQSFTAQEAGGASVGDQATWVAINDTGGFYYTKVFELRAENASGEVWVAVGQGRDPDGVLDGITGLNFPPGDCRNDGVRNVVTDAQAAYLLGQFTNQIEATDQKWFGAPDFRDGSTGLLPRPSPAGRQVVLVDNVRDDNFYDTNNANGFPYIAGFYTSAMIDFHDRNVMSIDGYDWTHRTGANPPHAPSTDPCTNAPARPFLYEGVFAHEYQHLIHRDYDPDEVNWVNEGMSDFAIYLNKYTDPRLHIDQKGNDGHILSYQGWTSVAHPDWNPIPRPEGPENSLTQWQDQGPNEILEDYGFAFSFMLYLADHGYGTPKFFLAWQHNPLNGIAGLDDTLKSFHSHDRFASLFRDMTVSTLTDAYIDAGAFVFGGSRPALSSKSLNSTVYFSGEAYNTPGAPPWGADYIPLGQGRKLTRLAFDGADQFDFPSGNDWTIDSDGYWTSPDEAGDTVYADQTDSSLAREVTVPAGPAVLTFDHWYQMENSWDFGFVQVMSDDGFVSLPCTGTVPTANTDADPTISANLPGYTGPTDDPTDPSTAGTPAAPLSATCDLSAYAGETVVLAFRLMSDAAVQFDGWHIRNVAIDGTPVDSTPADITDWDNEQFFQPIDLGFNLTLVGLDGKVDKYGHVSHAHVVTVIQTHLRRGSKYNLSWWDRLRLWGSDQVVAIVSGIPKDETVGVYFPYSLKVNGHERADGAGLP